MLCSLVRPTARNKEAELERSGRGQDGRRAVEMAMAVVAVEVLNDLALLGNESHDPDSIPLI